MSLIQQLALHGHLSDRLTRRAVRRRFLARPDRAEARAETEAADRLSGLLAGTAVSPLWRPGVAPSLLPDEDLEARVLGDRGLEAASHWPAWAKDLSTAEDEMLSLVTKRSGVRAEHRVLVVAGRRDSLTSYLADELGSQSVVWTPRREDAERIGRDHDRRGLGAVEVLAGPFEEALGEGSFDRVFAIESLPAGRDPRAFLTALVRRLRPGGRLFVQLAGHRRCAYPLSRSEALWLGLEAGALLPATDLPPRLLPELALSHHWELSGEHYERTFRAWRRRLEKKRSELVERAAPALGRIAAERALDRWRLSLLARETLFGARGGQEWWISHYALDRKDS